VAPLIKRGRAHAKLQNEYDVARADQLVLGVPAGGIIACNCSGCEVKIWCRDVHAALCVSMVRSQKSTFMRLEFFVELAVSHANLGDNARATIADIIRVYFSAKTSEVSSSDEYVAIMTVVT
jgi:hypothetical protein